MTDANHTLERAKGGHVLQVRQLRKAFGGHVVFRGADAEACAGEIVVLGGDNGSGKTTLLNILTGNLQPDCGVIEIVLDGNRETFAFPSRLGNWFGRLRHFSPERLAQEGVGRTWQELKLFHNLTVVENLSAAVPGQLGETPFWLFATPWRVRRQERSINSGSLHKLKELGLAEADGGKTADSLSLGQAKRIAILRSLSAGARLLFLDEPLAGLDRAGRKAILGLLITLVSKRRMTIFIVEHPSNWADLLPVTTRTWTIREGLIHQETFAEGKTQSKEGAESLERKMLLSTDGRGPLETLDIVGGARLFIARASHDKTIAPLFEIQDLRVSRGGHLIVGREADGDYTTGLTVQFWPGDLAVLEAPNGWGKTTLLEALAGLLPVASGKICLSSRNITDTRCWERKALGVSLLRAEFNVFPSLSVEDSFHVARVQSQVHDLVDLLNRRVSELSGGEQQRVALATAVLGDGCRVALLDEPFSGLDAAGATLWSERVLANRHHRVTLIALPSL